MSSQINAYKGINQKLLNASCTSLVSPYHQTLCREEQVLRSSLLLAYHTPTQDPYGQATLCSDGSLAGLSSVSLIKPFTITTSEAAGWMNIYSFATLGIPPTRMG